MCAPRRGESFADLTVAERCSHETTWAVVQGASDVVLDFFIIYLPIPMLWKLNMGFQRKIGVMAIFLTGFVYAPLRSAAVALSSLRGLSLSAHMSLRR